MDFGSICEGGNCPEVAEEDFGSCAVPGFAFCQHPSMKIAHHPTNLLGMFLWVLASRIDLDSFLPYFLTFATCVSTTQCLVYWKSEGAVLSTYAAGVPEYAGYHECPGLFW